MPTDDQDLLDRWAATLPNQPEIGERLLQRYREPHRRYHNVDHLRQVLTMIDSARRRPGSLPGPAGGLVPRRRLRHPARAS